MRLRSIADDMPVVSITRSARERSGSSSACSEATPAATLPSGRKRMAAAGLLVARGERLLGGLQEEHVMGDAERLQVVDDRCAAPRSRRRRVRRRQPRRARPWSPRARTARRASGSSPAAGCRRRSSPRPRTRSSPWTCRHPEKPVMMTRSCRRDTTVGPLTRTGRHGPGGGHLQSIVQLVGGSTDRH